MAKEVYHRDLGNGTAQSFNDDGSTVIWDITTGQQVAQTPPDSNLANAMAYGSQDDVQREIDRSIAIATALDTSIIGQREREAREAAIGRYDDEQEESRRRFDQGYDLQRDQFGQTVRYQDRSLDLQEQEADRRFGLDEKRFGLDERRFGLDENRFGLEQGRFGADLLQKDIELRNTPRSWLKLAQWETGLQGNGLAPYALQALEQGRVSAPGFNARQGTPGTVGLADVAQGLNQGKSGAANSDPRTAAVMAALKTSGPPSETPGLSTEDQATLDLVSRIYSAGAHRVANTWGGLPKNDKEIFRGGIAGLGGDPNAWDEQINASKWRTGSLYAA